jgi:hypothetical protein
MKKTYLIWVVFGIITLFSMTNAAVTDTTYTYSPDNDYGVRLLWDTPSEKDQLDTFYYILKWRDVKEDSFNLEYYQMDQVQKGDPETWSIDGTLAVQAVEGDTTLFEFRLCAVDRSGNKSLDSNPAYLSLYWPDETPPSALIGLYLEFFVFPKTSVE